MLPKSMLLLSLFLLGILLAACTKGGQSITTGSVIDLETATAQSGATCTDTDGKDNSVRGTAKGTYEDGTSFEFNDVCSTGFLIEYYCDGNNLENMNIRCPVRCLSGACVSE